MADAVQSTKDGRDEERFQKALLQLFTTITEITATLNDVKEDTSVIREGTVALCADMKDVKAALGIGANQADQGIGGQRLLRLQVDSLSSQLREALDAEGKRYWEQIGTSMAERSWGQTFTLAAEMERWLDDQADKISTAVKIEGLLTLADVAIIRDSGYPFEDRADTAEASRLLAKAEAVVTSNIDDETAGFGSPLRWCLLLRSS